MELRIRPGLPGDLAAIEAFTQDTFVWGDYVGRMYPEWLADPTGLTMVATADGTPMALGRVAMLSSNEAWLQGIRIHPDHRRTGVATAIGDRAREWSAGAGAVVVRLAVESWNRPARSAFVRWGYREVSSWLMAQRGVGENSPVPEGNGGRRTPPPERLRPARAAEVEPAMMSWASGPLQREARGLHPIGWTWRRLLPEDLIEAARGHTLWEGRPGWAIAGIDHDTFRVDWIETSETDADSMARALIDRAAEAGVERIEVLFPSLDWMQKAWEARGCEVHPVKVYELGL